MGFASLAKEFGAAAKEGAAVEREFAAAERLQRQIAADAAKAERAAAKAAAKEAKSVGHTQAIGSHGPKKGEWGAHLKPKLNVKTAAAAGVGVVAAQGVLTGHATTLGDLAQYVGHEISSGLGSLFGSAAEGACEGATGSEFFCKNGVWIGVAVVGALIVINISS